MIPFTRRELSNAWRAASAAANGVRRTNVHRLLLFYAAECGLKAVYLRRTNVEMLETELAEQVRHDVNRLLTLVRAGGELFLPKDYKLPPVRARDGSFLARNFSCGSLNQAWRYGGVLLSPSDTVVEAKLEEINMWISKELA